MEELNEELYLKLLNFDKTRRIEWMNARKPYAVLFELTSNCNFNCIHCYLKDHHEKEILSTEQVKKILDILYEKGILFLTLTGGEIFSRRDFIDIYLYAKKKGFLVELFTNGYLITDEIIKVLEEYPPLLVSISLYGAREETYHKVTGVLGAMEQVVKNCQKLQQANIRTTLKSPILTYTLGEMDEMRSLAKELGLQIAYSFDIHNTIDGVDTPKDFQVKLSDALEYEIADYEKQLREGRRTGSEDYRSPTKALQQDPHIYTCNIAMNSFVIDYKGNMLPCMKMRHHGISLLENEFDYIWEKFGVYKQYLASGKNICKKCDSVYFCSICPAEADFQYGDMEYRACANCKEAKIRKAFYCKEIDRQEALALADIK